MTSSEEVDNRRWRLDGRQQYSTVDTGCMSLESLMSSVPIALQVCTQPLHLVSSFPCHW